MGTFTPPMAGRLPLFGRAAYRAGEHVVSDGQHLDDVGRGHHVHVAAQLEKQTLRDGATERQREAETRVRAGFRLDLDLAPEPQDRALDDVHAHAPAGEGVGLRTRREAGLEDGVDQRLVAGVPFGQLSGGHQGAPNGVAVDAPAVVLEGQKDEIGFLRGANGDAAARRFAPLLAHRRGLDPVRHGVAQEVQ